MPEDLRIAHQDCAGRFDPHVWMDPALWSYVVEAVAAALTAADPDGAEGFARAALAHRTDLAALCAYADGVLDSLRPEQRLLVTAHDAFGYLARGWGRQVGGIQGLSTESEAGVRRIGELVALIVARGAPAAFSVDSDFAPAAMTAIVGPNGAGKSTLLKAALGIVPRLSGEVTIFGWPLAQVRARVAHVPQRASVDWDFPARVVDLVMMGLHRQLGLPGRVRPRHLEIVAEALARVRIADFAGRQIGQLSGGQQQRVFLARALAQEADLFVLDKPFAGVDAATETAIIGVLKSLRDAGRSVVVVPHDLATVTRYFDRVLMLNVRAVAQGPVAQAFIPETLAQTYGDRLATAQIDQLRLG